MISSRGAVGRTLSCLSEVIRHGFIGAATVIMTIVGCGDEGLDRHASPVQVVEAFFAAMAVGDTLRAVDTFDSATIARFQRGLQVQVRLLAEAGIPADMAPMPCIMTHAEIRELPARDVFARYLYSSPPRPHVGYQPGRGCVASDGRTLERRVLGYALEADSLAHVQFETRSIVGTDSSDHPLEIMTLVKRPHGWRILYGEIDGYTPGFIATILASADKDF